MTARAKPAFRYPPDDGPLTATQLRQVRKLTGMSRKGPVRSTLVDVDAS